LTGDVTHRTAYLEQLAYIQTPNATTNPPGYVKPGAGIGYVAVDSTRGYLTEQGGYDPAYTMTQLNHLARLIILSQNADALALAQKLSAQLSLDIDYYTGSVDETGGSRPKGWDSVTYVTAERIAIEDDTGALILWNPMDTYFRGPFSTWGPQLYKALGDTCATFVLDGLVERGQIWVVP
jgi:hypothetical protein